SRACRGHRSTLDSPAACSLSVPPAPASRRAPALRARRAGGEPRAAVAAGDAPPAPAADRAPARAKAEQQQRPRARKDRHVRGQTERDRPAGEVAVVTEIRAARERKPAVQTRGLAPDLCAVPLAPERRNRPSAGVLDPLGVRVVADL